MAYIFVVIVIFVIPVIFYYVVLTSPESFATDEETLDNLEDEARNGYLQIDDGETHALQIILTTDSNDWEIGV
eukprot:CAMPEP_0201585186 /NCGR_PEP_ID=MMETSP0190_2-20130828/119149_1 /ASSEMBLY_ACC=CAM_ASM_000263 /TAXON_ID=37353 /ORGANISM="Rosalina sp." /LENGTH=72 /DNA_ID=CAMNT_0048030639 /DNA_START=122 /DNA_END=336 /DNA_ORIENTATION=+